MEHLREKDVADGDVFVAERWRKERKDFFMVCERR
jgi:hypothetical protein